MRAAALFALAAAFLAAGLARDMADRWVAGTEMPPLVVDLSTEMRDREGRLLRAWMVEDGLWRLGVTARAVDPMLTEMLIAYEDKRFRDHAGVDPRAVLRAAWQAARRGEVVSGASTLTMQVARLIEDGPTGRWSGKLRQVRLALALERRLSKRDILALYLHLAPYGGNVEGVRAASLGWFGKEPRRLTPAEAALLVALPQAPEARRPDRDAAAALVARDRVLARMVRAGVLTAEAAEAARGDPVPVARRPFPRLAAHLGDRLRAETQSRVIATTLDRDAQIAFEALAAEAVRGKDTALSLALLVLDHRTGEVVASVGSPGYGTGDPRAEYVDMTRALRSPGSTLKPLVYALAFDRGLAHPQTLVDDRPVDFDGYAPQNFDGVFRGELPVAEALRLSLNVPVVRLTARLGPARLVAALRRSGAAPVIPGGRAGLAVALGGVGVTLEDLVRLYAALARGGEAAPLRYRPGADGRAGRVVTRAAAWQVGHILASLDPPPGAPAEALAYKTGTSYGHRDAWAIGFDGRHVVGVWMGRPDGTPVPGAFGGELAAPVLFEAFQRLKPAFDPLPPPPPETLIVATADLPPPLRRFRAAGGVAPDPDRVKLAFPPDGAVLSATDAVTIKLHDGRAPFTLLANGAPVVQNLRRREVRLPMVGRGFSTITVIDAAGRADRVQFELR